MNADQDKLVDVERGLIRVHPRSSAALLIPQPRGVSIATRPATSADLPFLDPPPWREASPPMFWLTLKRTMKLTR